MAAKSQALFHRTALATAIGVALGAPLQVRGQEIEEITVTATRREQTVSEIPYNISAVSGKQLENAGITDFTKLARAIPGLVFVESGPRDSGLNPGLIIRGLNVEGSGNSDIISVAAPTVSTYVDETPMFVNLYLKDVSRVEVLRGPQGTLYGSGSLGGTIRYIHNKPEFDNFYGEVSTRIGSTNKASGLNSDTYVVLNMPLAENFAIRTSFGYAENQGFVDVNGLVTINDQHHVLAADGSDPIADGNFPGLTDDGNGFWSMAIPENKFQPLFHSAEDVNRDSVKHARIAARWEPTDNLALNLAYTRQDHYAGGRQARNATSSFGGELTYTAHVIETMDREVELLALDVETDLGFASLSASVSDYRNHSDVMSDQTGVYVNGSFYATAYYAATPIDVAFGLYPTEDKGTTAEVRLVSQSEGAFDWVVGAFWLKQEFYATQDDIFPGLYETLSDFFGSTVSSPPGFQQDASFFQTVAPDYEDKALFGELTYHVNDRWQVTAGARTFEQQVDTAVDLFLLGCGSYCDAFDIDPNDPFVGLGANSTFRSETFRDTIFKLNTSFDINDDLMTYFTWSEGFRHGGANATVTNPLSPLFDDPALADYDSDLATNWEIGLKGAVADGRLNFSATAFFIDWDDMQFFTSSDGSVIPVIANASKAESKGLELESTYYWTDAWTMRLGLGWTHARLTEDFVAPGNVTAGFAGDKLPGVPDLTVNASINYVQALQSGAQIAYNLGAVFIDEIQTDFNEAAPNYTLSPSYTITSFTAIYSSDNWEVEFFVDNLTDERAPGNGRSPNRWNFNPNSIDGLHWAAYENDDFYLMQYIARPRTIGVGIKYRF